MTTYGTAVCDSTNCFRVGYTISQSPTTVSNGTASVVVTLNIYLQTKYWANDSGASWSITGDISASGSTAFNHTSGTAWSSSNVTLMATRTKTVTTSFTGSVTTNGSASVSSLAAIAGTASVNWSITTAQRPVGVPAAPTSAAVARVSDTQHTVTWTNTSPTSSSNPYSNIVVQRSTDGGAYATIATIGVVSSYSDTTTTANHQYQYRVAAKNGAGTSGYSTSGTIKTTPGAPSGLTATKVGNDIILNWTDNSAYNDNVEVWHSSTGGSSWDASALATVGNVATYTHVAPNAAQTHTYRVRSKTTTPALTSAYSTQSNTVQLQAPPNAPSNLAPSGIATDLSAATLLSWQHNPVDTTAQTKFEVEHRVVGAGTWNTSGQISSGTSSWTLPGGTYANGQNIEWHVRTWGAHATASAYSATATLTGSSKPTAAISTPGATHNASTLSPVWAYFDAESTPQAQWEAVLTDAGGATIETKTGVGTATTTTFATRLDDGGSYQVKVRVQDGTGLWGDYDVQAFTVTYSKPAKPTFSLDWDITNESVSITIDNPPTGAGQVDADHNEVWRRIGDDPVWRLVDDLVPMDGTTVDYIPSLGETNIYKVIAVSALPSTETSEGASIAEMLTGIDRSSGSTTNYTGDRGTLTTSNGTPPDITGTGTYLVFTSTDASAGQYSNGVWIGPHPSISDDGTSYHFQWWVRRPASATSYNAARMFFQPYQGGTPLTASSTVATALPADTWVKVETDYTPPAGANAVRPFVQFGGGASGVTVGQTAHLDEPSFKPNLTIVDTIARPGKADSVMLNAGPRFSMSARVRFDVDADWDWQPTKVLQQFAGRSKPVPFTGEQESLKIPVSGKLVRGYDTPTPEELRDLARQIEPAFYRDPDGRRVFVSIGGVNVSGLGKVTNGVSIDLTEVDGAEVVESA